MSNKKQTVILWASIAMLGMSSLQASSSSSSDASGGQGGQQAGYLTDCGAVQVQTNINQPVIGSAPQTPCTFINTTDSLISQQQYVPPQPTAVPGASKVQPVTTTGIGAAASSGSSSGGGGGGGGGATGGNQPSTTILTPPTTW